MALEKCKVHRLTSISVRKRKEPLYFAFIQFMECMEPSDEVDELVWCMRERWSTPHGVQYSFESGADSKLPKDLE